VVAKQVRILAYKPTGAEDQRSQLIARRVDRFTREEAGYWLSRMTTYGDAVNRWALAGIRETRLLVRCWKV